MLGLFGMVAAFGTVGNAPEPLITPQMVVEQLSPEPALIETPVEEFWAEERMQRGDTLGSMLGRMGVGESSAGRFLNSAATRRALRWLRPGVTVQARVASDGELRSLWFIAGRDLLVTIERDAAGPGYAATEQPAQLQSRMMMKSGEIRSSLFAATDAADLPDSVAMQIADIFGGDIDFHRDLRRGDRFTVVYEMHTHNGREVKSGRVLAAEFVNQKRSFRAVWWAGADAGNGVRGGYYTPDGKNLRKAFLRSPLEFSRVSSGFSMRFHPILQQWRAHKGVDYAAPTGTRVRSTGDGVIEFAGRQGGYGNLVVIRHHGGYSTWYAHLSGFGPGVRKGARIGQGEMVGHVGATGWATGPHLHYEFRVNNEHRNPLTLAFPAAEPVPAGRLASFRESAAPLAAQLDMLRDTNLALLQ